MTTDTPAAAPTAEHLEPCPFCGMKPADDLIDTLYPLAGGWRVDDGYRHYLLPGDEREAHGQSWVMQCQTDYGGCGARITGHTRHEAITAWNARAALSAPVAAQPAASGVDALMEELEWAVLARCRGLDGSSKRLKVARDALRTHLSTALTGAAKETK